MLEARWAICARIWDVIWGSLCSDAEVPECLGGDKLFVLCFPLVGAGVGVEDVFDDVEFLVEEVLAVEEVAEAAAATGDETLVTRLAALP